MHVGIVGGTGAIGSAVGARLAAAGHSVTLGSRDAEKASLLAEEVRKRWELPAERLGGGSLTDAASAEMVVVAVPADALKSLATLAAATSGKAVLSAVNVLERAEQEFVGRTGDSASRVLQQLFPDAFVVTSFNHLAAKPFGDPTVHFDADVLVAGHPLAIPPARALVASVPGLRAVDAGGPESAAVIEAFTSVLLNVNVRSGKVHGLRLVCPE